MISIKVGIGDKSNETYGSYKSFLNYIMTSAI